jgi:hypothetical protein
MWLFISGLWKAANGLLSMIPPIILALALAGAMATGCVEKTRFDHLTKTVTADKKARAVEDAQAKIDAANAVTVAVQAAKTESEKLQKAKDDALTKANIQLLAKTVDADRSRTELASLRDQSASDRLRMSKAAKQAVIDYATTASELLDNCSREYQQLADKAQGHAIDAGMIDGWPVK